ncbi:MAG: hypothetical protein C4524_06425 [Candidatus Zixiibacteriota bacterium]|nr:MAG: hypothetical protein C4524_06425 [candidate division Zixibacteria bacterium]
MLRYEVYIEKRLKASFESWDDAAKFALDAGKAIIIDGDANTVYYLEGDQFASGALFNDE